MRQLTYTYLDVEEIVDTSSSVVKLFNAIQQSHQAAAATQEELKSQRGSGKPTLPAPDIDPKRKKKGKDNKDVSADGV